MKSHVVSSHIAFYFLT
jgi:hypothetical protein